MSNGKVTAFSLSVMVLVGGLASTGMLFFVPAPAIGNNGTPTPIETTPTPTPTQTPAPTPTPTPETGDTAEFEVSNADLADSTVTEGTPVDVTAVVENVGGQEGTFIVELQIDGVTVDTTEVTLSPDESDTVSFTRTFDSPGEYEIAINGERAGTLTVEAADDDGSGDAGTGGSRGGGTGGSGGAGGGSANDGSDGSTDDTPPELTVNRTATDDAVTVVVENATSGTVIPIELGLAGPDADDAAISLERLEFTVVDAPSPFEVTVERPSETLDGGPAPSAGTPLGYVRMNTTVDADEVDNVSLRFRIDEESLPEETEPESVQAMRFEDGQWVPVTTTHENGVYTARADSLDSLAIVALEPGEVIVVDAEMPADWVRQGGTATVRATLENTGGTNVTEEVTVAIDGEPVATRVVELPPRETVDVEIEFVVENGGTVTVNGFEAGEVQTGTPGRNATPQDDTSGTDDSLGLTFWLIPLILALTLLGIGIWLTTKEADTDRL